MTFITSLHPPNITFPDRTFVDAFAPRKSDTHPDLPCQPLLQWPVQQVLVMKWVWTERQYHSRILGDCGHTAINFPTPSTGRLAPTTATFDKQPHRSPNMRARRNCFVSSFSNL